MFFRVEVCAPMRRVRFPLRPVVAASVLGALVAACGADLRQAGQLLDPPDVPTDTQAARIEREAPYPDVFEGASDPPRRPLLTPEERERLESDLERARAGHIGAASARLEARR